MLNTVSRSWLIGGWFATLAVVVAFSVASGASLSTSALLLAIGLAPPVVMRLIGAGAPSPTVAEILHSVDAKDGR
jgi:multisubunit Na+/H+ antiporter MnhG subunit